MPSRRKVGKTLSPVKTPPELYKEQANDLITRMRQALKRFKEEANRETEKIIAELGEDICNIPISKIKDMQPFVVLPNGRKNKTETTTNKVPKVTNDVSKKMGHSFSQLSGKTSQHVRGSTISKSVKRFAGSEEVVMSLQGSPVVVNAALPSVVRLCYATADGRMVAYEPTGTSADSPPPAREDVFEAISKIKEACDKILLRKL